MKYKCEICGEEKESNDCLLELQICLIEINEDELGDLVHSPIYNEKICSNCAKRLSLIFHRGFENLQNENN